ncbi:uncharacterized protein LOC121640006 [Melanotaenia boesemani]|uniref:uncharacterized protein LOC121640006 n=1 Tax=Melanotaenia boesemani TaxID=1250792 RepID=UPI001C05DD7B|nr:uncharacterized protein LOC121640006 [Melanotaenia boesemani]
MLTMPEILILFVMLNTLFCCGHAQDAALTIEPNLSTFTVGQTVIFICDMKEGTHVDWEYEIKKDGQHFISYNSHPRYTLELLHEAYGAEYQCCGRLRRTNETKCSNKIFFHVQDKPRARLTATTTIIPVEGRVSLTCSVDYASYWKFDWFKDGLLIYSPAEVGNDYESGRTIIVSQGGQYRCRGRRGKVYYTEDSNEVTLEKMLTIKPTVILEPNWPLIYRDETITLSCEIQEGGGTQWTYEWRPTRLNRPPSSREHRISRVTDSGDYSCRGRRDKFYLTQWSDVVSVTVSDKPRPVLSVSPSWLSPGSSVTLRCEIKPPSAGWRFYWYKAVPDLLHKNYSYDLLPGSTAGTEHDSYIIHGQTHTAGYVCRAGRGDPEYHTDYSKVKFLWSADVHPAASLTVNPDRVQHFTSDSVSLNCGGNSTEWRVMMFVKTGFLLACSTWGKMIGSSCYMRMYWENSGVYWCESGSGEFSNTVNITVQNFYDDGVILVSPVHPVTEGASVSLSCRRREQNTLSSVSFYHNDKLLQHDGREELNISAVSQSDEGFYKCQHAGKTSQQSWMSVTAVSRPESSSFPVLLIVGLVAGIVFILLILLCWYRRSKGVTAEQTIHQYENEQHAYSALLHGDISIYERIRSSENSANGQQELDYVNVTSRTQKS